MLLSGRAPRGVACRRKRASAARRELRPSRAAPPAATAVRRPGGSAPTAHRQCGVRAAVARGTCGAHAVHMRCVHMRGALCCMRGALCCMRGALCLLPVGLESVGAEHELHELEPLREQPAQRVDAAVVRQLEPTDVLHLMRVRASVSQPILHVLARGRRPGACCASCRAMARPARRESLDACSCHSAHRPH